MQQNFHPGGRGIVVTRRRFVCNHCGRQSGYVYDDALPLELTDCRHDCDDAPIRTREQALARAVAFFSEVPEWERANFRAMLAEGRFEVVGMPDVPLSVFQEAMKKICKKA